MSKDAEEASSAVRSPCPLCGNDKFTWGVAMGHLELKFKSDDASWLARNTIFGGQRTRARKCDSCGNVQLFAVE